MKYLQKNFANIKVSDYYFGLDATYLKAFQELLGIFNKISRQNIVNSKSKLCNLTRKPVE